MIAKRAPRVPQRLSARVRRSAHEFAAERAIDVAREIVDAIVADGDAEVLRRDVLELVRLVDDARSWHVGITSPYAL